MYYISPACIPVWYMAVEVGGCMDVNIGCRGSGLGVQVGGVGRVGGVVHADGRGRCLSGQVGGWWVEEGGWVGRRAVQ
jgi:hypothetical protein